MHIYIYIYQSDGVVAERRIFFLGALPGRSDARRRFYVRPYVRPSVRAAGRAQPLGVAAAWCPSRPRFLEIAKKKKTNVFFLHIFSRGAIGADAMCRAAFAKKCPKILNQLKSKHLLIFVWTLADPNLGQIIFITYFDRLFRTH